MSAQFNPPGGLAGSSVIGETGVTLAQLVQSLAPLNGQTIYVDANGFLRVTPGGGVLPLDVTLNGGVYMAGATPLPTGLSSNGGVIMTDGTVLYPGTFSNGGVLAAISGA